MSDFGGKVAVVTGTTGIGRAVALRLAQGGAKVVALGIDAAGNAELAKLSDAIRVRKTDVADPAHVEAAFGEIEQEFGGLDVIVNSAAVHPYGDAVTAHPETFQRCLSVNVGSIYLTAHFGVPLMRRRGGGATVNISSAQGHACQQGVAAYVASK